ncbi:MAG: class I adenylate-forming enzyme family protein [Acidimicrobiales bacterium]
MRSAPAQPETAERARPLDVLRRWTHAGDPVVAGRVAISTRDGDGWTPLTYGALHRRTAAMADALTSAGVAPGDTVALLAEPGGDWAVAFLGILRAGAVAVLLDVRSTDEELAALCGRSHLGAAVVTPSLAHRWPDPSLPVLAPSVVGAAGGTEPSRTVDDPAVLVWTSGTTGQPKGVTLSLANLAYVVGRSSEVQAAGPDARWLSVLPPNHLLELCCGLLPGLAAGSTTFVARSIVPHELWAIVDSCRVSRMVVVPMVLRLLRRHLEPLVAAGDFAAGTLEAIYCGGAPLDAEMVAFFDRLGVGVYQGYGLTEAAPVVSMNSPGRNRAGSVGPPLPGTTVRIGDDGEILVRGPGVMLRYWQDEAATRDTVDADGWLHTGDLGHLDGDGYLFVTGRSKSLIVLDNGKKVQPEEVEIALLRGDLFAEVCVVGVAGANGGEQVGAVVVPVDGTSMSQEQAVEEVRRLSTPLSRFKRPVIVHVHHGELPRTAKRTLRRDAVARLLESVGP